MSRPDSVAGPRSHSSLTLCLDSSRTLLIRDFHGLNRESVVPRDGRGKSGQAIVAAECLAMQEWIRSAGKSVNCEPREGATCRTQAISINIADRTQIIPMPLNDTFAGSAPLRQSNGLFVNTTHQATGQEVLFGHRLFKFVLSTILVRDEPAAPPARNDAQVGSRVRNRRRAAS
jgi:hypothetical protein